MTQIAEPTPLELDEQGLPAGFVSRLMAFTLDLLIVVSVASVVTLVAQFVGRSLGASPVTLAFLTLITAGFGFIFWLIYFIGLVILGGQTIGKRIMGLRVVRLDGQPVKPWAAVVRYVGYWLSLPLFWGYLLVLVDNRRQAFQDKLAGTVVIYFKLPPGQRGCLERYLEAMAERRRRRLAAQRTTVR